MNVMCLAVLSKKSACAQDTLNSYLELGKDTWVRVRHQIQLALRSYVPNTSAAQLHGSVSLIALVRYHMSCTTAEQMQVACTYHGAKQL